MTEINDGREAPLAAMALLFALHQAREGLAWLGPAAPDHGPPSSAWLFVLLAHCVARPARTAVA